MDEDALPSDDFDETDRRARKEPTADASNRSIVEGPHISRLSDFTQRASLLTFSSYASGMSLETAAAHSHHIPPDEQKAIAHIIAQLQNAYEGVPSEAVAKIVNDLHSQYNGAKVRDFVPMFVERHANRTLARLA